MTELFKKLAINCMFIFLILFLRNRNHFIRFFTKFSTKDTIKSKNQNNVIRIGIYAYSLSNGGVERNTALLLNYLSTNKIFDLHFFYQFKSTSEYKISLNIKRISINSIKYEHIFLKRKLMKYKIEIFLYQQYEETIILMLKSLKKVKIIFYNHSSFLIWIYSHDIAVFSSVYNHYKNSKFVISLIHFENDYLFKKWGIQSIYMNNFITFEYEKVIQSDLSSNNILMIGRADDKNKRFDLGIKAMKYIIKKINNCQMIITSKNDKLDELKLLIKTLSLDNNIKFAGYSSNPEIYFKNISLHIFPSIAEAFPMVLSETKIYGIPSILVGIDYITTSKEGVIVVYDDNPETIANHAIKLLSNMMYRKKIGKAARRSMKKLSNIFLFKKWKKLILAVNEGEDSYRRLVNEDKPIPENESIYILKNQINLLKKRENCFKNITFRNILNFSFVKNLNCIKF